MNVITTTPPRWTWFRVPTRLVEKLPTIGDTAVRIYLVLASHANRQTGVAFPGVETIAQEAGIGDRATQYGLKALERAGLVAVERSVGREHHNTYRLLGYTPQTNGAPPCTILPEMVHGDDRNGARPQQEMVHGGAPEQEEENKRRNKKQRGGAAVVPDSLNTPEFVSKWGEWLSYRKERRLTCTPITIKRQLAKLAAFGPADAIASIEASLSNGWQGLFEPRQGSQNGKRNTTPGPGQRHPADTGRLGF